MSIAPFLPTIPTAAPADPGTATDAGTTPDGSTGTGPGSAFGDALAAALAGSLVVPVNPAAVTTPAASGTPTPAAPAAPVPAVGAPLPAADVAAAPVDVPLAPAAAAPAPVPSAPAGPVATGAGIPRPTEPAASTASTASTASPDCLTNPDGHGLGAALGTSGSTGTAGGRDAGGSGSTGQGADSTVEDAGSTVENPQSTVANPHSTVANPQSTLANPHSTEGVSRAVVQQVFPEVTRMASTAQNGTHRITLTLQPEQLGEVRVTLVVRDGSVHVQLAGDGMVGGGTGMDAAAVHRALASGVPELQRMLERTGAEARVSVRDPFASMLPTNGNPLAPAGPASAPSGTANGFQAGPDAQTRSDTQARQGEQSAREQPARDQPRRQEPRHQEPRAAYPREPTPVAGRLDRTV